MTRLAWLLSFCAGFISLSEEILWVRIISFAFESTPKAFALVVTAFLGGIALGAFVGKDLSERQKATPLMATWLLVLAGSLLLWLPSLILSVRTMPAPLPLVGIVLLIVAGAAVKGALFPIVHHLGSAEGRTLGRSVSRTYFSNILGATLGPLVTGLVLLDHFSSGTSLQILGILCFLAALPPSWFAVRGARVRSVMYACALCMVTLIAFPWLHSAGEKLMVRLAVSGEAGIRLLVENRYGIVHASIGQGDDDIVFGGNVYDGRTNIDLLVNSNLIDRAYLLYVLHPAPKRVLVIGMSSGAWTRVLSSVPDIRSLHVVEINPAYMQIIRAYPHLAPLLDDPRVNLHIDDGRRWLRRSHDQFDLIVMNTTFHWRSYATNLLSTEMLQLVHESLAPGGVFAFNTTGSNDAFLTASKVFPFALRYRNFVYAADHDFRDQLPHLVQRIRTFRLDGQLLVPDTPEAEQVLSRLAGITFTGIDVVAAASPRPLIPVTDQNMITEFRFGRGSGEASGRD